MADAPFSMDWRTAIMIPIVSAIVGPGSTLVYQHWTLKAQEAKEKRDTQVADEKNRFDREKSLLEAYLAAETPEDRVPALHLIESVVVGDGFGAWATAELSRIRMEKEAIMSAEITLVTATMEKESASTPILAEKADSRRIESMKTIARSKVELGESDFGHVEVRQSTKLALVEGLEASAFRELSSGNVDVAASKLAQIVATAPDFHSAAETLDLLRHRKTESVAELCNKVLRDFSWHISGSSRALLSQCASSH